MKITFYGHACLSIETQGKHLLFDPFITGNELASHIDINSLPADYILISHGHGDHLADAPAIAKRTGATIISNYEIVTWFGSQGLEKGHPMNHGGAWSFDFGRVKYVNAVHSSVLPDGTYGGNPGGFILYIEDKAVYFAGDTALTLDMQLIPHFADLDLAILPIGDNFTMGIEDAVMASDFVKCDKVLGMHYDTFGYIKIDPAQARSKFGEKNKELILLDIGESMEL